MQRHRNYGIGRSDSAIARPDHPFRHHWREIGPVTILQSMHEIACDAVVDGNGAQTIEDRRIGDRLGRYRSLPMIMGKRQAEDFAIGPLDQLKCRPAGCADGPVAAHQPTTATTDGRIDEVDEIVADLSQKGEATRQSKLPLFPVHVVDFTVGWVSLQDAGTRCSTTRHFGCADVAAAL